MVLIVAGFVWLGLAVVFVIGLICVAGRPIPAEPERPRRRLKRRKSHAKESTSSRESAVVKEPVLEA